MGKTDDYKLIITEDGSHSLYNKSLNETYHSFHGAIQESQHVFIKSGLEYNKIHRNTEIKIFEVGFGTGLNALLTAIWCHESKVRVKYDSIEAYPLSQELTEQLNHAQLLTFDLASVWYNQLHKSDWNQRLELHDNFIYKKILNRLQDHKSNLEYYDIIFFDAFAPSKQPEMWSLDTLTLIAKSMNTGGVFVTYCAQGQLKRNLKSMGLKVETLDGPPGKKEMVRAIK